MTHYLDNAATTAVRPGALEVMVPLLAEGYGNTGSCRSAITYIDGDQGILRYRGIPIEVLAAPEATLPAD